MSSQVMNSVSMRDLAVILPYLLVLGGAIVLLLWDAFSKNSCRVAGSWFAALVLLAASAMLYLTPTGIVTTAPDGAILSATTMAYHAFAGAITVDGLATFAGLLIAGSAFMVALLADGYLKSRNLSVGEFQAMLLFSTFGMLLLVASTHLIVIFVALETLSLALYVMIGFRKNHPDSAEAALKYFLLGGFASGFFLYGVAIIYGKTGSVMLDPSLGSSTMGMVGMALLIVGVGFKISAVPFHLWTPDVYQGAPTPVTVFLSASSKAAGVALLLRIIYPALSDNVELWRSLWPWMAAATMLVGNLVALVQHDVKRILAYSSIAHMGFILMAIAGGPATLAGGKSAIFYLVTYMLATVGSFGVLAAMQGDEQDRVDLDHVRGLSRTHPLLAGLFALFLLSLAGIPPLVGFSGKLFALKSALGGDLTALAIFAGLNSAGAVYYYLRIIIRLQMENRAEPLSFTVSKTAYVPLIIAAAGVVYFGVAPGALLELAHISARALAPLLTLATLP